MWIFYNRSDGFESNRKSPRGEFHRITIRTIPKHVEDRGCGRGINRPSHWILHLREYQTLIERIYYPKDKNRGVDGTFRWFVEETGELARALRTGDRPSLQTEFADCLAWLASLATICKVDLEDAMAKYRNGCPKCHAVPCRCEEAGTAVIAGDAGIAQERGVP